MGEWDGRGMAGAGMAPAADSVGTFQLHSVVVMALGGGQVLGWHLLRTRWGLDRAFGIEPAVLGRWLAFVEVRAAAFAAGRSRFRVLRTWPRAQGNPGADVLAKSCELCWERFVACANRLRVGLTQRFLWPNQRRQWLSRVGPSLRRRSSILSHSKSPRQLLAERFLYLALSSLFTVRLGNHGYRLLQDLVRYTK